MGIGGAENQRLFIPGRIDLFRQLFTNHPVKLFGNHSAVKGLDIKIEFIFQFTGIHLTGFGVNRTDLIPSLKVNAMLTEQCGIANRRFMVDEPVFRHRFAVRIGIDRMTKNLAGMLGWRSR